MRLLWLAGVWLVFLSLAATAHEITFSQVNVTLGAKSTDVTVKLPTVALTQEVPTSLPTGTSKQTLQANPLPADVQDAVRTLLVDRLHLTANGTDLPLTIISITPVGTDIDMIASGPAASGSLEIDANLFPTDPLHKVFVTVYRGETLAGQYALDASNTALTLDAPERPLSEVIGTFILEGIHHIFIGQDHILFVIALILLGGRLWSQLKIITAFTLAHSITLALATLNIVQLPSQFVESVIALSIVVVGLHDIVQLRGNDPSRRGPDPRIGFAFVFGLVHGFGFASVLRELDLPQQALAWSLAAFNIGVEIGQVTIVLLAAPVIWALNRFAPKWLARSVLNALAALVVLAGAIWLYQRLSGS